MSRNKNQKVVLIKKQKKLIASRLMQISLKVDDYVYKDIPISVKSAEMFIQEVSSYQDKCYGDKPSLQVIEKLIHCMKGIIAEQQELRQSSANTDVTLVDVQSILASSVDDDLTQCTPNIDTNNILEIPNNDINVIDICDDIVKGGKQLNMIENEIIDLSNDENDNNDTKRDGPSNELLQKAISKLTISEDPLSFTSLDPEICSQSILSSFKCVDDSNIINTHKIIFSHDFEADIQPITISRKKCNPKPITKYIASTVSVKTPEIQKNANKSITVYSTESINILESNPGKIKTNKNTNNEKIRRKRGPNKIKRNKDGNKPNRKLTAVKKIKQNKIVVEKKNAVTKALGKISMPENFEKDQNVPTLSRWIDNTNQQSRCAQFQDNSNATESVKNIYNKNVENDLSWIENIRYVREVTQEEHISAVFENGFWEDYTLPNDWNDDDFLYN